MACKKLNRQILINRALNAKKDKTEKWEGYLSNKLHKFHKLKLICTHDFGLCLFSEIILYRLLSFHIGFLLSRVDNVSVSQKLLVMGKQPGALNLSTVQRLSTTRRVHY